MMILIEPKFAPITFKLGFLECPLAKVQCAFIRWRRQHYSSVESKEIHGGLPEAFQELQPLTTVPRRWLLLPTHSDWVAYFDNCTRGPDPSPPISYIAGELGCRGVVVTSIPHTLSDETGKKKGLYGATQFELFAAHKTEFLNCERSVSVAFEAGRWTFETSGKVQSFEDTAAYQKRRIVERFTMEMLKNYCHALGIYVDSLDFYQTPAFLVATNDPLPAGHKAMSLEQARQELGFGTL